MVLNMLWDRNEILSLDFKILGLNDGDVYLGVHGLQKVEGIYILTVLCLV